MASSGWQGDVTLTSGGFGYSYFKGNLRIDSITHSGNTVNVSGVFAVHNDGGQSSYYVYPINAAVNGSTNYQQVVAGNQWIANGEYVESAVSFSFSAAATDTSHNIEVLWSYNNGTASNSITYTLYFDASISPPTGLNVSNVTATQTTVTGNVSISGWGVGSGTRYRELQVWAGNMTGDRRYQAVNGDATSGNITCNNNSSGSLTITPNTKYWVGGYASNGSANTGSQPFGTVVTLPPAATCSFDSATKNTITINWAVANQNGEKSFTVDYQLDSGSWVTVETISTSGAKSGSFTITGLKPNSTHNVNVRTHIVGGSTVGGQIVTVSTTDTPAKLYGSVSGTRKRIKEMYCSVNGERKKVEKIYGSVNGERKIIYEDPNL